MSATMQLPGVWGTGLPWNTEVKNLKVRDDVGNSRVRDWERQETIEEDPPAPAAEEAPPEKFAFLRKHTVNLLRRYLYASIQIGRSPSLLSEPVGRGWASSRPIRTFEDAVIFVLDVEKCLDRLNSLDRQMLSRVVLQEYTHAETAVLLGMSARSLANRFPVALDRLTERLIETGLLVLPR